MTKKNKAIEYINELARAISITEGFLDSQFSKIRYQTGFQKDSYETRIKLNTFWREPFEIFITKLRQYIDDLEKMQDSSKFSRAYEVCVWMDERITYLSDRQDMISLSPICPIDDSTPTVVSSLNSNVDLSKVWINPKFPVRKFKIRRKNGGLEDYEMANSNIFYKMNNYLQNCSYFPYSCVGYNSIKNVIVSNGARADQRNDILSLAFSPISDCRNLIDRQSTNYTTENGYECCGMTCSLKTSKVNGILERTQRDWIEAGIDNVDVLFMPEVLGTKESCGINKKNIDWMYNLFVSTVKEKHAPMMTVLPSYWAQNDNSATIVSHDGTVLGVQRKYVPYISSKDQAIEALEVHRQKELVVIHIPYIHRVAVVICSEFLEDDSVHWSKVLCSCLGISLLIVPSYSPGEREFINLLSSLKRFGTSIVWGNCCGAIREDNNAGIGGFESSGELRSHIFSKVCKCGNKCENKECCAFVIRIPLGVEYVKGEDSYGINVQHVAL